MYYICVSDGVRICVVLMCILLCVSDGVRIAALRRFPDFSSTVAELEAEEVALVEEERAGRPLLRRLQSAMNTHQDREGKARRARGAADEGRAAAEAAETRPCGPRPRSRRRVTRGTSWRQKWRLRAAPGPLP